MIILNEFNLAEVVVRAILGRRPEILLVETMTRPGEMLVGKVLAWLRRTGRVVMVGDVRPEIEALVENHGAWMTRFPFATYEAALDRHFEFDRTDALLGDYALVYRKATTGTYIQRLMPQVTILAELDRLADEAGGQDLVVRGVSPDQRAVLRILLGREPRYRMVVRTEARRLINAIAVIGVLALALPWLVRRLRSRVVADDSHILGIDAMGTGDHLLIAEETLDDPKRDALLVIRSKQIMARDEATMRAYAHVMRDEGVLSPADALAGLKLLVTELAFLVRRLGGLSPFHFWAMIMLPYRRLRWRALFKRFRLRAFWARDEYGAEHVVRTQELRRAGILSLGLNHGYPGSIARTAHWRYVDFDVFYAYGMGYCERHYMDRWPADMKIRAVGSYHIARRYFEQRGRQSSGDIAFYTDPVVDPIQVLEEVLVAATALADRTIWVKVKPGRLQGRLWTLYMERIAQAPANVRFTERNSYELALECRYTVGGPTSVLAEAVALGGMSFLIDIYPPESTVIYREYPDMCVRSGGELVERIRSLENGSLVWRQEKFAKLIDLSGQYFYDVVRSEIGLPPKGGATK